MDHQTFAQLLGNYGEFVGAIAVVITLIYLAIQVRHSKETTEANTKAIELQAYQAWQVV
jgi:heme exporter protein D